METATRRTKVDPIKKNPQSDAESSREAREIIERLNDDPDLHGEDPTLPREHTLTPTPPADSAAQDHHLSPIPESPAADSADPPRTYFPDPSADMLLPANDTYNRHGGDKVIDSQPQAIDEDTLHQLEPKTPKKPRYPSKDHGEYAIRPPYVLASRPDMCFKAQRQITTLRFPH